MLIIYLAEWSGRLEELACSLDHVGLLQPLELLWIRLSKSQGREIVKNLLGVEKIPPSGTFYKTLHLSYEFIAWNRYISLNPNIHILPVGITEEVD